MRKIKKVLLLILVCVCVASIVCMCEYRGKPYFARTSLHTAPHEGFSRMHDLEYTTYPENTALDSPETQYSGSHRESSVGNPVRLPGYAGIQSSPDSVFASIDIYSQASGSHECSGSTLTNSMGPLCLNSEQTRLLRTRGGNLSGGDSQIG